VQPGDYAERGEVWVTEEAWRSFLSVSKPARSADDFSMTEHAETQPRVTLWEVGLSDQVTRI
jgi:hypothetical protein